jgi:hypothetical protein
VRRALLLALVLMVGGGTGANAADPSLEVHLDPRKIGIDDTTLLTVRILEPQGTPEVDLGALENLEVVSGPATKTEFSWINGEATRALSFSYILQGLDVGTAAVGPVTVELDETVLSSEVVTAEIVPGSVVPQRQSRRNSPFPFDPFGDLVQRRQPTRSARIVLRQLVDDSQLVLGQPVSAAIVLDTTTGGIDGFEWLTPPAYPSWWAQRIEPPERVSGEVVEVNGVRYNRFVVVRHVLVPLKTGPLEVPSVEARIGFRSASLFSPQQVVERATEAVSINVAPRSRPPEGYSGAVGDLRYSANLDPQHIEFGESAVLSIELRGHGNLPLVEEPALWPRCSDCESYPPEEESDVTVDAGGIHGSRVWRTTLVPRDWGEIELEPVMLAVYDPAVGHYRKQTLGPLRLVVGPPPATPTPKAVEEKQVAAQEEPEATESAADSAPRGVPTWIFVVGALILGLALGGVTPLLMARRRGSGLPPRSPGQSPADRARELQVALERWWMDTRSRSKGRALEGQMQQLRRELEAIRFAPSRADHTETVLDLEDRLKDLMRRA